MAASVRSDLRRNGSSRQLGLGGPPAPLEAVEPVPFEALAAPSSAATSFNAITTPRTKRLRQLIVVACDLASLVASFTLGALLRGPFGVHEGPTSLGASLEQELPYVSAYMVALVGYGLYYRQRRRLSPTSFLDLGQLAHSLIAGSFLTVAVSAGLHRVASLPKFGWLETMFMVLPAMVLLPVARAGSLLSLSGRGVVRSRLVVVGSGIVAGSLTRRLQRYPDIEVVGFVDDNPHMEPPCPHLGRIAELPQICSQLDADRVLVAFTNAPLGQLTDVLRRLPATVSIGVVPRLFELVSWQSQVEELHGLTIMDVAPPRLGPLSQAAKRATDIVVSAVLLLLLSPLMVVIAVAIKLTSPGPVFFRQARAGYKGKEFQILKFRSMKVGAEKLKPSLRGQNEVDGPLFKLHQDPRVTRIGRHLRSTSLDEIPQLLNVLLGHMSLVGPRPFVPDESAGINGWAARRFDVKPGITGLWQISGRNDLPFEELRQLDYSYVASWSLWWDLKILWQTPGRVLRRHGAY